MKKNRKLVLSIILWGVLIPLVLFAAKVVFLSLRYSPEYMVREYFMDLGDTDDYLTLPARKLEDAAALQEEIALLRKNQTIARQVHLLGVRLDL